MVSGHLNTCNLPTGRPSVATLLALAAMGIMGWVLPLLPITILWSETDQRTTSEDDHPRHPAWE